MNENAKRWAGSIWQRLIFVFLFLIKTKSVKLQNDLKTPSVVTFEDQCKGMAEKYDIRDDEDKEKKRQEIFELLVASGYFRARIKV